MTNTPNDLLDHAVILFPAPDGAMGRVIRRRRREQRRRRAGVVITVVAVWLAIGAVALLQPGRDAVPADTPTPSPRAVVDGVPLPSNFPASLPLPEHLRAVGVITDIDEIEAWFRTDLDPNELKVFFEQAMPDAGWPGEPAAPIYGGHWDYSVRPRERSAVLIVVRTEPGPNPGSFTGGHGAYDLDAPWDVYVHLTNLPPVDVSEPSVASESGSFRTGVG